MTRSDTRFAGFPDEALDFFEGLRADNSRTYFNAHKDVYERAAREPMLALLAELEPEFGDVKIFRPNRDVRFAKDKSPYKTQIAGLCGVQPGLGYYVSLGTDGLSIGGGCHTNEADDVRRYRVAVDDSRAGAALEKVVRALRKAGFELYGDQVKTRPRGVAADHPRLELMRYSSLAAVRHLPPGPTLESRKALQSVRTAWRGVRPLVDWIGEHVGPPRRDDRR